MQVDEGTGSQGGGGHVTMQEVEETGSRDAGGTTHGREMGDSQGGGVTREVSLQSGSNTLQEHELPGTLSGADEASTSGAGAELPIQKSQGQPKEEVEVKVVKNDEVDIGEVANKSGNGAEEASTSGAGAELPIQKSQGQPKEEVEVKVVKNDEVAIGEVANKSGNGADGASTSGAGAELPIPKSQGQPKEEVEVKVVKNDEVAIDVRD
ncbi:uncharacterized protein LOC113274822 [Papaver somniferum]|nr:uncharacterized protein LOC113274822 [Papaver somniferum]